MTDFSQQPPPSVSSSAATGSSVPQLAETVIASYTAGIGINPNHADQLSGPNALVSTSPNFYISSSGLSSNLTFLSVPGSPFSSQAVASTSLDYKPYAIMISSSDKNDTTAISPAIGRTMLQMLQVTSKLYADVLSKCRNLVEEIDLEDEESKRFGTRRLADVLEPFHSVLKPVFQGLLESVKFDAVIVSFLLVEVLPAMTDVEARTRVSIIQSVIDGAKPSIRLAAAEALDSFGVTEAREAIASLYQTETNKLVRDLLEASMYPMQNA